MHSALNSSDSDHDPLLGEDAGPVLAKLRSDRAAAKKSGALNPAAAVGAASALPAAPANEPEIAAEEEGPALFISKSPKHYSLHEQSDALSFRHPWVMNSEGRGVLIRRGIKSLSVEQRGNLKNGMLDLLKAAPRIRKEVPDSVDDDLAIVYFAWITKARPKPLTAGHDSGKFTIVNESNGEILEFDALAPDWDVQEQIAVLKRDEREVGIRLTDEQITELVPIRRTLNERQMRILFKLLKGMMTKIDGLESEKSQVESERDNLLVQLKSCENQIRQLAKDAGARLESERSLTLRACLEHFKERWNPPGEDTSPGQKVDMVKRVERVVEALGPDTLYCAITREQIRNTIKVLKKKRGRGPIADNTKINLRQGMKTFCTFLTWSTENDGMGLSLNPTQGLSVGSKQAVQQRKQKRGEIEMIDPRLLLKQLDIDLYYRALIAVLGFAGLRLSEAAALRWSDIDFEKGLINVTGWEIYPNRKTVESERVVKPFRNLWPLLEEFKKQKPDDKILFPRLYMRIPKSRKDNSPWAAEWTWMAVVRGRIRARDLSTALKSEFKRAWKKLLKRAPEMDKDEAFNMLRRLAKNEPALRLRRFWSSKMDEIGMADLEVIMGAHSLSTSNLYYKNQMAKILRANVPEI